MFEQGFLNEVLTPDELAERLKCSTRTIHRAAAAGQIDGWRTVYVGNRRRFVRDLEAPALATAQR